ncbi:MAG: DUF2807 domain-containing protein [Deltaproteobacteria bacterium]|nr:DUF2807 domain-containing protein [Deltaproteobacteria bacterium]
MRRRQALSALFAFALGCQRPEVGSGHLGTSERAVAPFYELQLQGEFSVTIELGAPRHAVTVEADDNLLANTSTDSNGRRLSVSFGPAARPTVRPHVRIAAPDLVLVRCEGNSTVELRSVHNARLQLDLKDAGEVTAAGSTQKLKVFIDGRGRAHLEALSVDEALVHVNGSGAADIAAPKHLEVELHGSARVTHAGTPVIESVIRDAGGLLRRP